MHVTEMSSIQLHYDQMAHAWKFDIKSFEIFGVNYNSCPFLFSENDIS